MVTVARTPGIDRMCGTSIVSLLEDFAHQLAGTRGVRHVPVTSIGPRDLVDSDVFVFAARVDARGLEATARDALSAWSQSKFLAGKVAFWVLVGDCPADFGRQYDAVAEALAATGATVVAPAFTLVHRQTDHSLAVGHYCRYWAPHLPALRHLAASTAPKQIAA
jgi:hypothetical protein